MRKVAVLTGLALILLLTGHSYGQELKQAEDILKWFPQGSYLMIKHKDIEMLMAGRAYPLYQEFFEPKEEDAEAEDEEEGAERKKKLKKAKSGNFSFRFASFGMGAASILDKREIRLPESMFEGLIATTDAHAVSLADAPEDDNKTVQTVTFESRSGKKTSSVAVFLHENSTMAVHEYIDLDSTLKEAIKKGEVAKTGKRIAGRPVYTFQATSRGHRSSDQFAWASEANELIVASDREKLRKMILAGRGKMMRLLDDDDYVDLIELVPDLGAKWMVMSLKQSDERIENAVRDGEIEEEDGERILERSKKTPLLRITSLKVENAIVSQEISVYTESEHAEEAFNKSDENSPMASQQMPEGMSAYKALLKERRTRELDNNIVTTSTIIDKKLMEAEQVANAAMQKMMMQGKTISITGAKGEKIELKGGVHGNEATIDVKINKGKKKDK